MFFGVKTANVEDVTPYSTTALHLKRFARLSHLRRSETLLFCHIPKTAGTSFRTVVEAEYWRHQRFFVYGNEFELGRPPDPGFLARFERRRRFVQIVYGHFEFGIHEVLEVPPCYATILREPISRVVSFYYHIARDPAWGPLHARIKEGVSLRQFVEQRLNQQAQNYMTRMLAGVPFAPSLRYDTALLDRAKANIEQYFCAVGTVDTMGDVVQALGERFGWRQHAIPTLNVMQQPREDLDRQTRESIAEQNRLDIELYRWVIERGTPGPTPASA
jgi:hypothetical protein